jgi:hypothetical protein
MGLSTWTSAKVINVSPVAYVGEVIPAKMTYEDYQGGSGLARDALKSASFTGKYASPLTTIASKPAPHRGRNCISEQHCRMPGALFEQVAAQ